MCGGISSFQFGEFNSATVSGLSQECFAQTADDILSQSTAGQIGNLTVTAVGILSQSQIGNIYYLACAGITIILALIIVDYYCVGFQADQIANLSASSCVGFSSYQIGAFQPSAFNGFTPECVSYLDPQAFSGVDAAQVFIFSLFFVLVC